MGSVSGLRVLLVDDDKNIRSMLAVSLNSWGCDVSAASSASEALAFLERNAFDLVLTDFKMDPCNGIELVKNICAKYPKTVSVVMTAYASFENSVASIREGAFDYLPKPFTNAQLKHLLTKVRTVVELQRENERLRATRYRSDYFVGLTSPAAIRLDELVQKLAPSRSPILISGESGTGKTELAKLIHNRSPRSEASFTALTCTNLSETALTEALAEGNAGSGSIFLDEIGDLSSAGQTLLLRFLERQNDRSKDSGPRVIAATHKKLADEFVQGRFREDLYHRLNAFECFLVPLRYRREDLPVLIHKLLAEFATATGSSTACKIPETVMDRLTSYSWPGNLRELRNVLERLVLLSSGREMSVEDLPRSIREESDALQASSKVLTLDELERQHIQHVLAIEGNLERAAALLGTTTVTLWRKRKEYGLP